MKKTLIVILTSLLAAMFLTLTGCEKETPVEKSMQQTEKKAADTTDKKEGEVPEETLVEETTEELYEKDKGPDEQSE